MQDTPGDDAESTSTRADRGRFAAAPDAVGSEPAFSAGKAAASSRWLLMVVGIVTLVAGVIALAMPFLASVTAAILVGWVLIVSGAVGLFTAVRRNDGWHIAAAFAISIVSIIGGLLMLMQPIAGIFALTTLLIAYFAASGILRIWYGAKSVHEGGGWMIATGALAFLLAVMLFFSLPLSAAWLPGVMLGVDLIFWGALQIALATRAGRGDIGGDPSATSRT